MTSESDDTATDDEWAVQHKGRRRIVYGLTGGLTAASLGGAGILYNEIRDIEHNARLDQIGNATQHATVNARLTGIEWRLSRLEDKLDRASKERTTPLVAEQPVGKSVDNLWIR